MYSGSFNIYLLGKEVVVNRGVINVVIEIWGGVNRIEFRVFSDLVIFSIVFVVV